MSADIATPIHFAEFDTATQVAFNTDKYAQVRLCTRRHRGEHFDHFNSSFTYASNGAHIDQVADGIARLHYVETFDKLRAIDPTHRLLPENT